MERKRWLALVLSLAFVLQACSSGEMDDEGMDSLEDVPALDADASDALPSGEGSGDGLSDELSEDALSDDLGGLGDEWGDSSADNALADANVPSEPAPVEPLPADPAPLPMEDTSQSLTAVTPLDTPSSPEMSAPVAVDDPYPSTPPSYGSTETYTVKKGDTLMRVAFETTGDMLRWREIYEMNRGTIQNPHDVPPGTQISVPAGQRPFVTQNGEPYRIKRGDTLGRISNKVYGTSSKWKRLWNNNPELIKNPNQIYAGFTLYYEFTSRDREEKQNYEQQGSPELSPAPMAELAPETESDQRAPASAVPAMEVAPSGVAPAPTSDAPVVQ